MEKLQSTNELVLEAIDVKIGSDATSRAALNKLHMALIRALGEVDKTVKISDVTAPPAMAEGLTSVEEQGESVLACGLDVKMESMEGERVTEGQDSILEDLLDDDDDL